MTEVRVFLKHNWGVDQTAAQQAPPSPWTYARRPPNDWPTRITSEPSGETVAETFTDQHSEHVPENHILLQHPAAVIARIDGLGRIMARHQHTDIGGGVMACTYCGWMETAAAGALPDCPDILDMTPGYADRPGFDPAWLDRGGV